MQRQYEDTNKKLKDRVKEDHNSLRYQKMIAATAIKILEKNSKILSIEDYKDIALKIGKKPDKITAVRIKRQMTEDIGMERVNSKIQELLIKEGLDDKKYAELIKKAENVAKSTKDYISIANEIKEMHDLMPQKKRIIEERRVDYTKYLDKGKQTSTAKQTITTNETPSIEEHRDNE